MRSDRVPPRRFVAVALAVLLATACIGLAVESQSPAAHTRATATTAVHHVVAHPDGLGASSAVLLACAAVAWWMLRRHERPSLATAPARTPWRRRGPPRRA